MRHCPSIGLGLGLSLRSQGGGFTGLLDTYSGAAAAYSLRALSSGWLAGDVVEVRRSSDGTLQNFTASQITNGDLLTFTGAGDGFVATWYDQSGNANNATQATTTAQPKIVSAGALVVGGLDFDGVDDFMTTASYAVELSQNSASVFAVYEATGSFNNARVLTEGDTAVGGSSQFIIPFEGGSSLFWVNGDETGTKPTGLALIGFDYDQTASTIKAFSNGSQSGADLSNPTLNSEQRNYTFIGSNTLGNILFGGTIKEIITYKSDQSANRAAIETNINEFYTIY